MQRRADGDRAPLAAVPPPSRAAPPAPPAKKDFDTKFEKYGYMADLDLATYSTKNANVCLGTGYQTIAEAKLLETLTSVNSTNIKKKDIDAELTRVIRFTKQFGFKIRDGIHSTIMKEAESILIDG